MRKQLESLVSSSKKLASSVSQKAKTALSSLVLGTALLGSTYTSPDANADVLLTMESKNLNNYPKRFWMPNTDIIKVFVYADNTSQNEGTAGIEWELKAPKEFKFIGFRRPNPYVTLSSSDSQSATNDFFHPKPMDSSTNYVAPPGNKNCRLTEDSNRLSGTGIQSRQAIENKKGWVGIYYFEVPTNCPLGDYQFEIANVKAIDTTGQPQITKDSKMTVRVMRDARALYSTPESQPALLINYNNGIPYIHVSENWNQLQLETSSDFKTWTVLKVNDSQNTPGVKPYWNPFTYVDTNCQNEPNRFYRVKSVE